MTQISSPRSSARPPHAVGGASRGLSPERAKQLRKARLPLPAILYLLCVLLPITFQMGPLALTLLRAFLLLLILPILVKLLMGRYGRIFLTDILFALHIVWAALALKVNNPDQMVEQIGSVGAEFLGGYLVGRVYIRTPEAFVALSRWLIFLVFCTTPFAIYEARTGWPILIDLIRRLPGVSTVAIVTIEARLGMERVQAVFAHPIHYGLFCSVAFSLAFVALKGVISDTRRYVSSVIVGFSGFLALSSGALLAIILQIGLIAWATIFDRIRWRWWLLVGLFALAYVVIDLLSNRTPIRVFMSYATFSANTAYWRSLIFEYGIQNVWAHPLFGIGLNDWARPDWMSFLRSVDNFWLLMGMRYGVMGFLTVAGGYGWAVALIMRRNFETDPVLAQLRRAWVFTFLGLSFTLCTVHVWTNVYSFVFFMFGAGMWLITAQPAAAAEKADKPEAETGVRRGPRYSRFPAAEGRKSARTD